MEKHKEIMILKSELNRVKEDKEENENQFKKQKNRMERDIYELENQIKVLNIIVND